MRRRSIYVEERTFVVALVDQLFRMISVGEYPEIPDLLWLGGLGQLDFQECEDFTLQRNCQSNHVFPDDIRSSAPGAAACVIFLISSSFIRIVSGNCLI